jgi:two-component system LytT family sensor kinase
VKPIWPGFPSFWTLQTIGWLGFGLLVIVASFPSLKQPGEMRGIALFVFWMFAASCLLRPICRALLRRSFSWTGLEVRGFAWSLLAGAAAALVTDLVTIGPSRLEWATWLGDFVQFSVVLFLWCTLYFSIKQWQQAMQEKERLLHAESAARQARISALRYQLNPHFLFNALNAVSTLVLDGNAPAATRMLSQIGDLLRSTLDNETPTEIPLSQEIAFTERYLAIEQTRLGRRLRVDLAIAPETLDGLVPSMLLQPLVENAVHHGVAQLIEGGAVAICTQIHDAQLQIVVTNSGPSEPQEARRPENGVGLSNTVQRLNALYGTDHRFVLEWPNEGGCAVTVELPFRSIQGTR